MNFLLLFATGIVITIINIVFDLKTKRLPNKYQLLFAATGLIISYSISFHQFFNALVTGGIFLLVGFIIAVSSGWGGGDGKFLGVLGTFFHPYPVLFLLSLMFSTMLFKLYIVVTGIDPGDITREEWEEKGIPFTPSFLLAEGLMFLILFLIISIM